MLGNCIRLVFHAGNNNRGKGKVVVEEVKTVKVIDRLQAGNSAVHLSGKIDSPGRNYGMTDKGSNPSIEGRGIRREGNNNWTSGPCKGDSIAIADGSKCVWAR